MQPPYTSAQLSNIFSAATGSNESCTVKKTEGERPTYLTQTRGQPDIPFERLERAAREREECAVGAPAAAFLRYVYTPLCRQGGQSAEDVWVHNVADPRSRGMVESDNDRVGI